MDPKMLKIVSLLKPRGTANQVFPKDKKLLNIKVIIDTTLDQHTKSTLALNQSSSCSICQDVLGGSDVRALNGCAHQFHGKCLEAMLMSQEGQEHICCPLCFTMHGIKTGSMPTFGSKMLWWKVPEHSLPGYENYGTIVIKYCMENGTQ